MERIEREKKVIGKMIAIYCRRHHHEATEGKLCPDCNALLRYALERLDRCPKGNGKSSCRKCTIHCYSSPKRAEIREVMKYVGPRMIFIHPIEAVRHLLSEIR